MEDSSTPCQSAPTCGPDPVLPVVDNTFKLHSVLVHAVKRQNYIFILFSFSIISSTD